MHVYDIQQMADFLYVRYETPPSRATYTSRSSREGGGYLFDLDL